MLDVIIGTVCQEPSLPSLAARAGSYSHPVVRLRAAGSAPQVVQSALSLSICYLLCHLFPNMLSTNGTSPVTSSLLSSHTNHRVNFTNVTMSPSIPLSNFLTSFLSLFTFRTKIMILIEHNNSKDKNELFKPNYIFHLCLLLCIRKK